ncbi:MAG: hypothetical protein IPK04_04010 [Bdellovibrionales bacterium]|nr:hypothetical protein [Bdellovibrionales bacterium]
MPFCPQIFESAPRKGLKRPADFVDYLETLGLKAYDGTEKASLIYIKEQLKSRGW